MEAAETPISRLQGVGKWCIMNPYMEGIGGRKMNYTWNSEYMWDTVTLPAAVGRYLKLASPLQMQVLLWMATAGRGQGDAAACAAALGGRVSEGDCADALRYWVAEGVLQAQEAPKTDRAAGAPGSGFRPVCATPARGPVNLTLLSAPAAVSARPVVPRPAAVKPQMGEVLERRQQSAEFSYLLEAASSRLGKPLSPGNMETLLYLYDTAGLPAEVILMVIAYAVGAGKGNMRYIEKTALDWAEKGIDTIAAADEYLCRLARLDRAWAQVAEWFDLEDSRPTLGQKENAEKWLYQWQLPEGLLRLAYEQCLDKTGKFQSNYIDRILEGWRLDRLDTPEKVLAAQKPQKKPAAPAKEGGFDVNAFEQMVRAYTPKYRKRG